MRKWPEMGSCPEQGISRSTNAALEQLFNAVHEYNAVRYQIKKLVLRI